MHRFAWALVATLLAAGLAGCIGSSAPDTADIGGDDPLQDASGNDTASTVAWGTVEDAPIRPGASLGGYCTFNFLFTDAAGHAYIGTAGHCTEEIGERVELAGVGEIGTVVYDSDEAEGADAAVDFSLVLLDEERIGEANPRMLGWEGPTGSIAADELAVGDEVALHGYGLVLGQNDATRDRSGFLVDWDDQTYRADMPAVNGDSGSPLLHLETGKALGIISHYGTFATPPSTDEGPLMPFVMNELTKAGFQVDLATVDT